MTKVTTILILLTTALISADYTYTSPKNKTIQNNEKELLIQSLDSRVIVDKKALQKELQRNRLFTKAYLRNNQLTKKEKKLLDLAVEEKIASFYIEKLKKEHKPSEAVIKSFYLDHYESFKPTELVSIKTLTFKTLKEADEAYLKIVKSNDKESFFKEANLFEHVPITKFGPKVREWVRKQNAGAVSEPIKIKNSYIIDYIVEKESKKITYENLQDNIKEMLTNIYIRNLIDKEYEKLQGELK